MPRSNLTSDSGVTRCFPAWIDSVLKAFRREKRCVSEKSHNEEYRTFHILDVILLSESVWMKVTRTVSRCQQLLKSSISIFHLLWPDLQRPPGILHYHYHIPCCSTRWLTLSLSLSVFSFLPQHVSSKLHGWMKITSQKHTELEFWQEDHRRVRNATHRLSFLSLFLSVIFPIHPSFTLFQTIMPKHELLSEYNANNF